MGYHPETLVFSFPPYRRDGWLNRFKPWVGFDIWHIDPERQVEGQRRDDSCGWFPRNLTPAIQKAVDDLLGGSWDGERRMVETAILRRAPYDARYPSLYRMPIAEGYALAIMYLTLIDCLSLPGKRKWRRVGETSAQLRVLRLAQRLTLNDDDNLLGADTPEAFIGWLAAAYRREIRPWWRHPRWHFHHWQVNFDLVRNLKRMFERCGTCGRPLGFGCIPAQSGGHLHHVDCLGRAAVAK